MVEEQEYVDPFTKKKVQLSKKVHKDAKGVETVEEVLIDGQGNTKKRKVVIT